MDELQFISLHLLLLLLFLLFFFMAIKGRAKPSTQKLPIVGNLHQLLDSLPHRSLAKLAKKYGPLMHLNLGEVSTVLVSSPELAKLILKTHDIDFAQRSSHLAAKIITYDCTDIVFAPYGGHWRQLRKICTMELLNPKRVHSFRWIREEEVCNLIKTISSHEGSPINISDMIFSLTYGMVSRAAFGKKYKDQEEFMSVIMKIFQLATGFCVADLYPSIKLLQRVTRLRSKLEKLHEIADQILGNIIKEHRNKAIAETIDGNKMEGDIVDVMIKIQEDGDLEFPISDDIIKAVILDLFSAGSDTSSATIEWAISEMLKNPRILERAQAEIREVFRDKGKVDEDGLQGLKYLNCIIKETLRLHPAVPLLQRESRTDVEINGYHIPVKTKVMINTWAIGRDPKHWTEAEKFYPERFLESSINYKGSDFEFIPFGCGRRICPGISFARANIELPLAKLLYHFDWKLPNGMKSEEVNMIEGYGLTCRKKHHLFVVATSYHHILYIINNI